ncbi:MAG: Na/Pi cotransporter family protein [Planctomycetota bacterium]|jgi:phosphate:Na+ symporter
MAKKSHRVLRISIFLLSVGIGLSLAVAQEGGADAYDDVPAPLSNEQVKITLKGIAKKDFAKAEALDLLRSMEPDRFTEAEIAKALKWIGKKEKDEEKGKERVAELVNLWKTDRAKFGAHISSMVEAELQKATADQKKKAIRGGIFGTIGGLGLFLFGMGCMSDGLKKAAGQRLKSILEALTRNRVIAVLVGTSVTALIQSSSATTVMVVGLVNAGLLTLKQALCVVLGANIGTTITAALVSILALFKITNYALPAIGLGFVMTIAGKSRRIRNAGEILMGFGILFIGIHFMKEAFEPLKDSIEAKEMLIYLGKNPILAVLAGTAITMLLQSSSASIAMVQVLAFQGAFGTDWPLVLSVTIPYILGDNIGTTITAQIAAVRASRNARRTAMGHTIFNTIGVLYMLPIVWTGWYAIAIKWLTPGALTQYTIMTHIFAAHCIFNVFNTILFLPFVGLLRTIVVKLIPITEEEAARKPVALESHLLHTPVIALNQAKQEIIRMSKTAKETLVHAIDGLLSGNKKKLKAVREMEDYIDDFQLEITSYLSTLSRETLSDDVSTELPVLLHAVNDLERIGDHAVNIVEIAERKIEQRQSFSEAAVAEAKQLKVEVEEMFDHVIEALESGDVKGAKLSQEHEEMLNKMQKEFRGSHVQRMTDGVCTPETGLIFIDLVDNIEKIGDHLTNIAQAIIGGLHWEGVKPKIEADS